MFLSGTAYPVRTSEIATHFHVDPSTVTKTIESLAGSGLVDHEPYRGVVLTGRGRRHTYFLIRRRRLLGLVFTLYGLSEGKADRQARDIEEYVAKDTIDRICASLGPPGCRYRRDHPPSLLLLSGWRHIPGNPGGGVSHARDLAVFPCPGHRPHLLLYRTEHLLVLGASPWTKVGILVWLGVAVIEALVTGFNVDRIAHVRPHLVRGVS